MSLLSVSVNFFWGETISLLFFYYFCMRQRSKECALISLTSMISFLNSLAKAYASRYDDISEFCFVFPGKRGGKFFLRDYRSALPRNKVVIAPETLTVAEFVAKVADRDVAPRLDLLFMLYDCYCDMNPRNADGSPTVGFDSFRLWGETVLSDFDDVDRYGADPDELFRNIRDFRDIATDFLTDAQRRVMEQYFGHTPSPDDIGRFWKNFHPASDGSGLTRVKHRFLQLWESLGPLYHRLAERLEKEKLATSGGVYRLALERLRNEGTGILPWKKVVFVGFNALSTVEHEIFSFLQSCPSGIDDGAYADFYWDATGPVLSAPDNSASRFVQADIRDFPSPAWAARWLTEASRSDMPQEINVIAAPSNAIQAKIAGGIVGKLSDTLPEESFSNAEVAVVLPDEALLLPVLYSLPESVGDVNLTMGYPLRLTSAASFISLLRRLQSRKRIVDGETSYYHADLKLFLSHPFVHMLAGSGEVASLRRVVGERRLFLVPLGLILQYMPDMADIMRPLGRDDSAQSVIEYVDSALASVEKHIDEASGDIVKTDLDRDNIIEYRVALRQLGDVIGRYGVSMHYSTLFSLLDRLLGGVRVSFEGEPLRGLQIMGMLETRGLDFRYVVVPSMNERIFPRRQRARSFIPDSLRAGYGLPPSTYQDALFSYYFYRMISRAEKVWLIYDASPGEGLHTGDVSRYVLQLKHLYAPDRLKEEKYAFTIASRSERHVAADKNDEVMEMLEGYLLPDTKKNFSASALKHYISCPVQFFYQDVIGISAEAETAPGIDAITLGNIFHRVMQTVYLQGEKERKLHIPPKLITRSMIDDILADEEGLRSLVRRAINRETSRNAESKHDAPLRGSAELLAPVVMRQVRELLEYDKDMAPFSLYGCELADVVRFPLSDGREVNMTFSFDRLDKVNVNGVEHIRVVDYKTGKSHLEAKSLEEIFTGHTDGKNIFQVLLYSRLVRDYFAKRGVTADCTHVMAEIYSVSMLRNHDKSPHHPKLDKEIITDYAQVAEEFESRLDALLCEILDSSVDFESVPSPGRCRFCNLSRLCGTV